MAGHLAFYKEYGISPVRYAMSRVGEHFERRDALYRSLGLPAVAFSGVRVLEVAPGSGQNSLYLAACRPDELVLVEPNPAGLRDIEAAYAGFDRPHTSPSIHSVRFEEFEADNLFDIVLCENWLGSEPNELGLIGKLASLVAPGGVLVITAVPLAGFFPNVMRKLLALRLMQPGSDIYQTTTHLLTAFASHLATIPGMTRSAEDWVQDCMVNPHYLRVALPFETLLEVVGGSLDVLSTSPRFFTDWRWFKAISGADRTFNKPFLESVSANLPNFLDYRRLFETQAASADDSTLSEMFERAYQTALEWEDANTSSDMAARAAATVELGEFIIAVGRNMARFDPSYEETFIELAAVWAQPDLLPSDVAGMKKFASLFGRETVYVSFTRRAT